MEEYATDCLWEAVVLPLNYARRAEMEPLGSDPARPAAGKSPGTGTFMYPVSPTSIKGHCREIT